MKLSICPKMWTVLVSLSGVIKERYIYWKGGEVFGTRQSNRKRQKLNLPVCFSAAFNVNASKSTESLRPFTLIA